MKPIQQIYLIVLLLLSPLFIYANDNLSGNALTPNEKVWLQKNNLINIAVLENTPPLDFKDENNKHAGFHTDMFNLINEKLHTNITLIPYSSWTEAYNAVKEGAVHSIAYLSYTKQREKDHFIYSSPYHFIPYHILVKQDNTTITNKDSLVNKKITVREKTITNTLFEKVFPSSLKSVVKTHKDSFFEVKSGLSDATVIGNFNKDFLEEYDLKIASTLYNTEFGKIHVGTNQHYPLVASIIQKGLESITLKERNRLKNRWFKQEKDLNQTFSVSLSMEEKEWLSRQNDIKIGVQKNWFPVSYIDIHDGKVKGLDIEIIDLLNSRLENKIKIYPDSFNNNLSKLKTKNIDAMFDITPSKERKEFYKFTQPYIDIPHVIVSQKGKNFLSLKELSHQTVAVEKGYMTRKKINDKVKNVTFKYYNNSEDAIDSVSRGETHAYVGNKTVVLKIIERDLIPNLQLNAKIRDWSSRLTIGVNKDSEILRSIFEKMLSSISKEEKKKVLDNYIGEIQPEKYDIAFRLGVGPYVFDESSDMGIEIDLVKHIFDKKGYLIDRIYQFTPKKQYEVLKSKKFIDVVVGINETSDEGWYFSDAITTHENVIVTRTKDNFKIEEEDDLLDLRFVAWSEAYKVLTQRYYELFNPIDAPKNYLEIKDQREQCRLFFEEKIDAIVIDKKIFEYYKHILRHKYSTNTPYSYHDVLNKSTDFKVAFESQKMRDDFNTELRSYKKTSEYKKMVENYFMYDTTAQLNFVDFVAFLSSKYMMQLNDKALTQLLQPLYDSLYIEGIKIVDDIGKVHFEAYKSELTQNLPQNLKITRKILSSSRNIERNMGKIVVYFNENLKNMDIVVPPIELYEKIMPLEMEHIKKSYARYDYLETEESGADKIALTQSEKDWIKEHPLITVHNEMSWAPFNYYEGEAKGYSIDYIKTLAKMIGINLKFVKGSWNEHLNNAYNKKLDVMLNIVKTPEREKKLLFTNGYVKTPNVIVGKENTKIYGIKSLYGKTVAIQKGFFNYKLFASQYPEIKLYEVNNTLAGLKAIQYGKADAYIDLLETIKYSISENLLSGLEIKSDFSIGTMDTNILSIAVRNDYDVLRDILQKAMKNVDRNEIDKIKLKWFDQISDNRQTDSITIKEKISFTEIFPFKELLIGLFLFIALILILWKLNDKNQRNSITIKNFLVFIVSGCLLAISVVTVVTLENLENNQKNKLKSTVQALLHFNQYSFDLLIKERFSVYHNVIYNEERLNQFIPLFENPTDIHKKKLLDFFQTNQHVFKYTNFYLLSKDMKIILSDNNSLENTIFPYETLLKDMDSNETLIMPFKEGKRIQNYVTYVKKVFINNRFKGYLLFEINPNNSFTKLLKKTTIGETGESYLFNKFGQFISVSKFENELQKNQTLKKTQTSFLNLQVKKSDGDWTLLAKNALLGKEGVNVDGYENYRGAEVYGAWAWNKEFGIAFAVEIDTSEAMGDFIETKKIIIIIVFVIVLLSIFLTILIAWVNNRSKKALEKSNSELNKLLTAFDENIIASKTDTKGIITYASKAFCEICQYTEEELIGKPHNIIRHPDVPAQTFKTMWETLKSGKTWTGEVKNRKKDGGFYWVSAVISPIYNSKDELVGYNAIRHNITNKKEVEDLSRNLERKVKERTYDLSVAKSEIELIHKHTQDSIRYASLIQHALIPENQNMNKYFEDYFTIWEPKDIVGGDIYLFEELKTKDACILMVIDCTGHGVPGAFVTMLVKAIEREVISYIKSLKEDVSPAKILRYFNKTMKKLLKQESIESISNAGFDGGVLYYNKEDNYIKYAGANTPLFYIQNNELTVIRPNRHSIGYKDSDANYKFDDFKLDIMTASSFYISTDGFFDQCGGEKGFPYGKKSFKELLCANHQLSFTKQSEILMNQLNDYTNNEDRTDDITVVGVKIGK